MPVTHVASALADYLNDILAQDPAFTRGLIENRIPWTNEDLDVVVSSDDPNRAGFMGAINAFMDRIGEPRIAFVAGDDGAILRFEPLQSPWRLVKAPNGVEVEVDRDASESDIQSLISLLCDPEIDVIVTNARVRISRLPEGTDLLLIVAENAPEDEIRLLNRTVTDVMEQDTLVLAANYKIEVQGRVGPGVKA